MTLHLADNARPPSITDVLLWESATRQCLCEELRITNNKKTRIPEKLIKSRLCDPSSVGFDRNPVTLSSHPESLGACVGVRRSLCGLLMGTNDGLFGGMIKGTRKGLGVAPRSGDDFSSPFKSTDLFNKYLPKKSNEKASKGARIVNWRSQTGRKIK